MSDMLISLCLPTYNRAECIGEQLKRLSKVDRDVLDKVEIIVSDNCSTDETQNVILSYKGILDFTYIRNVENIGPDANFLQCFERAKGEYIWLCGDDDYLCVENLAMLLKELEVADYGLIHLGSCVNGRSSMVYSNVEDFISAIGIQITFMSSNIISRKYFQNIDLRNYIGTYFLQVPAYLISAISADKNKMVNIRMFNVGVLYGTNGGYNVFKVFVENFLCICKGFMDKGLITSSLYEKAVEASKIYIMNIFFHIYIARKPHNYETDGALTIIHKHIGFCNFWSSFTAYSINRGWEKIVRCVRTTL